VGPFRSSLLLVVLLPGLLLIKRDAFPQDFESYDTDPILLGARGSAMAYSLNAEGYDVGNMYINPATLAFLQTMNVVLDHRFDRLDNVMHESVASPVYLSDRHKFAVGAIVTRTGAPRADRHLKFTQYGLDVGYSYLIWPDLSAGILISARYGTVQDSALWGGWLSFGLMYSPSPAVSYAFSYRGLGVALNYSKTERDSRTLIAVERQITRSLEVGSIMKFPSIRPLVTVAISAEHLFQTQKAGGTVAETGVFRLVGGEVAFRYRGGIELRPFSLVAFRVGYVRDQVGRAQVGLGINLNKIQANFGIQPSKKLGQFYEASLSIALGRATIPW
jgi:hypothetical protein